MDGWVVFVLLNVCMSIVCIRIGIEFWDWGLLFGDGTGKGKGGESREEYGGV